MINKCQSIRKTSHHINIKKPGDVWFLSKSYPYLGTRQENGPDLFPLYLPSMYAEGTSFTKWLIQIDSLHLIYRYISYKLKSTHLLSLAKDTKSIKRKRQGFY